MSSLQYLKVAVYFLILTKLIRFSVELLCCEVFKSLGKDLIDFGIRNDKSLCLGMPRHPKVKFKDNQNPKLGGVRISHRHYIHFHTLIASCRCSYFFIVLSMLVYFLFLAFFLCV